VPYLEAIRKAARDLDDHMPAIVPTSNPQATNAALDLMERIAKETP